MPAAALKSMIVSLISGVEPTDDLGREHQRNVLSWLAGTDDIFRRDKPLTPSPHLVSYFLLVDRPAGPARIRPGPVVDGRGTSPRSRRSVRTHLLRALDALGLGR
jgi:hypothetical protein